MVVAYVGWLAPLHRMPIDYGAMFSRSVPFAVVWGVVFAFCLWRFGRRALLLLIGAPMALYWPVWLIFNHFAPCYFAHNCV